MEIRRTSESSGKKRSPHWYELRKEIPWPSQEMPPEEVGPNTLRAFDCPECLGRGFRYLPELRVVEEDKRYLRDTGCEACHGTGLVCPTCRGQRLVRVVAGIVPNLLWCPDCTVDGKYSEAKELEVVEKAWREISPF